MTTTEPTTALALDEETISAYRRDGVVRIRNIVSAAEAARFRDAAAEVYRTASDEANRSVIFKQYVNVWRHDDVLRELTLDARLAAAATALAGVPLRLWHDHLLIKPPHNGAATEFHQDAPYWPHSGSRASLSAWVALVDVPAERGCMTFIPGSHDQTNLRPQDLADRDDLFREAPDLRWEKRLTIPLRAGDCTFHNAYLAHSATPNLTDDPRIAHVAIYVDAGTTYTGAPHVVTDGLGLPVGEPLDHELFPLV
ncbi:Ectoine hydroxylase-related dioxygenase, phytanoyl-CoA dioxygenase (PhyH) family [Actinopolymorpha cephalotaxi]|uniref:Ectoine hydroxylase-related dioxygenase (Phytanoyl-CoA dioxygenase family) n=1 Tax=Actinopolymorpha cephalotaxi TaxID=504797 RepID=A0A1I2ZTL2_9ACTN|nr:phytanoyl-CoA dioxygenase family protein [Actinopolymorpha cephalotaxi]NYH84156.1 ectoine hydroxylase-related dioxygenase (phytanoyl-CoA dioxygenase family) [Actinopolymorpha cephalotaxi]SFH41030.1 Ectoine hydroxylase-related dioxygenase, phytanoyl-CoA dioxygenase (PhyH) family [Actinopolymorpha cephalotaxi]